MWILVLLFTIFWDFSIVTYNVLVFQCYLPTSFLDMVIRMHHCEFQIWSFVGTFVTIGYGHPQAPL